MKFKNFYVKKRQSKLTSYTKSLQSHLRRLLARGGIQGKIFFKEISFFQDFKIFIFFLVTPGSWGVHTLSPWVPLKSKSVHKYGQGRPGQKRKTR